MSIFFRNFHDASPFLQLANEIERAARTTSPCSPQRSFSPRFDVSETKEGYELVGELPGLEQSDVNIEWAEGNVLSISGTTEKHFEASSNDSDASETSCAASDTEEEPEMIHAEDATSYHKPTVEDEDTDATVQKAEKKEVAKAEDKKEAELYKPRYWISERLTGSFNRTFKFQSRVDHDNVKASLKNGILRITVPKAKPIEPRRIAIQ